MRLPHPLRQAASPAQRIERQIRCAGQTTEGTGKTPGLHEEELFDAIGVGILKARGFGGLVVRRTVKTRGFVGLNVRWSVKTLGFVDPGGAQPRRRAGAQARGRAAAGPGLHEKFKTRYNHPMGLCHDFVSA